MGLFDRIKKTVHASANKEQLRKNVEKEMYDNNLYGYRDLKDSLEYQDSLLKRVNEAQLKYKRDGDIEAVIRELEFAFIESDPPCTTSQNIDLAKYYVKAGLKDKAWGYLNRLQMRQEAPLKDIRFAQAKILKAEKKWIDAIDMFMRGYLAKSEWNNSFQEEMFLRDIKPLASKLGWDDRKMLQLSEMVKRHVNNKDYSERSLIDEYKKFCSEMLG